MFSAAVRMPTQNMQRGSSVEMDSLKARRPKDMRMDCRRFELTLQARLPTLMDEILSIGDDYHEST